jgi:hypothetical protein
LLDEVGYLAEVGGAGNKIGGGGARWELEGLEGEEDGGIGTYPASAWRLYASKEKPGATLTRMNVKPLGVRQSAELLVVDMLAMN